MLSDNCFEYSKTALNSEVILLNASMNDFSYGMHAHEEFSFGVTLSGRQHFFSGGINHQSHPSNVIVFNPDEAHDGHSGGDDTLHYKMLYVHPDQLRPMLKSVGVPNAESFYVSQCVHNNTPLQRHILYLASLIESPDVSEIHYSSALFEFAQCLAQQESVPLNSVHYRKDSVFERVREYLHSHVAQEVSLDELSHVANMSKYHLLRRFRDYFGMTPHKYWQSYRLNKARKAIELGMPIADVTYTFGFSDLSYFNRCFKPVFGMTPYQFRRNVLQI